MDPKELEELMNRIPRFGKKVGFKNIEHIIEALNQQMDILAYLDKVKIIHVAGTNGKGSVCEMLSQIYDKSGYHVGLFTSPHIQLVTERIQIDNKPIDSRVFERNYHRVDEICRKLEREDIFPTFFEWIFAIGLISFFEAKVEVLILEVGIGGRLDTTNVIMQKTLAVITAIGMDHQEILGDTLESIAMEKAGIIPVKGKAVVYETSDIVRDTIKNICQKRDCQLHLVAPKSYKILNYGKRGIDFSIYNKYYNYERLHLNSLAIYQLENILVVLEAIYTVRAILPFDEAAIRETISHFQWPGRLEKILPNLLIDGAHNELGMEALLESLKLFYKPHSLNVILGMKGDKDSKKVIDLMVDSDLFHTYYVVDLSIPQRIPKEKLYERLEERQVAVHQIDDLAFLLREISKLGPTIATGSLYLMSDIRNIVDKEELT